MSGKTLGNVQAEQVDAARGREIVDAAARRHLGIPGSEFAARWARGEYEGDNRLAVMKVAMMLPLGR